MAAIPVWSGNLRLSLVLVPVRMFPAISTEGTIAFAYSALVFASVMAAKAGAPNAVATAKVTNAKSSLLMVFSFVMFAAGMC